ncbi:MAG: Fur family transcriptional regulator [Solirubrobacteraceae bacterium]
MTTDTTWAEHARSVVHAAGCNRGAARDALIDLFAERECALTVAEVEHGLAERRPVGRASVYRALDLLSGLGLLARVEVGDGMLRYERSDGAAADEYGDHRDRHHHHMVCEACGALIAFGDPQLEDVIKTVAERYSFWVSGHEVTLHGVCQTCRLAPDRDSRLSAGRDRDSVQAGERFPDGRTRSAQDGDDLEALVAFDPDAQKAGAVQAHGPRA